MLIENFKMLFRGAWYLLAFIGGRDFWAEEQERKNREDQERNASSKSAAPIAPKHYWNFRG